MFPWRRDRLPTPAFLGFSAGSEGKESTSTAGDLGWIPGLGRSPGGGGHGSPLQYSCLENPMDRGAWWTAACGVSESDTTEWLRAAQHIPCHPPCTFNFLPRITDSYLDDHNWLHLTCMLPFFCDPSQTWLCSFLCYWQMWQILVE